MEYKKPKLIRLPILRDRLTEMCHTFIRLRDIRLYNNTCVICRRNPIFCAYHIVPKSRGDAIRWDELNIVGACAACNEGERWNRSLYRDKHIAIFGKVHVEAIEERARHIVKLDRDKVIDMTDYYRRKIETVLLDYKQGCGFNP